MDVVVQNRYLAVRSRLAELNYSGTFGADAVDLVEKLVNDVMHTTAAYKQIQEREARLSSDLTLAQGQLFPLHKENTRLARENHQLHVDSIKQKDGLELKMDESNRKIKDLESKLTELKFLCEGKEKQLRIVEKEKEKIKSAFEATTEGTARPRTLKGNIQMSSSLPPPVPVRAGRISAEEQEIIDQMKAQARVDAQLIETLRNQLDSTNVALRHVQEESQRLMLNLTATEAELAKTLNRSDATQNADGSPAAATSSQLQQLLAADQGNKRVIDQLNGHVDFLNEQLALREAQLVEASEQIMRAENMQTEMVAKTRLLDQFKHDNASLVAQLKAVENKLNMKTSRSQAASPSVRGSRAGIDGQSVAASAVTAGSGLSAGANRTKASSSSVTSRGYSGGGEPVDHHQSTDEEDRDLDLSGDNDRDLDLDEHPIQAENRRPKSGHHANSRSSGPRGTRTGASSKAHPPSSSLRVNVPTTASTTNTNSQVDTSQSAQAVTLMVAKLSAEKKDLSDEVQRLQSSEGSLRDRVQRADEKITELKSELSESKRTGEQLARKLKEKDTELARAILEHADARKSLVSTVSTLESRLAQADEWGDKTTEKEDALAAAVADRLSLQAQVDDLKGELYALRRERGQASQSDFESTQRATRLEKDLAKTTAAAEKSSTELMAVRTDLAALVIRFEDSQSALEEKNARLISLQSVADNLSDEAANKTAALAEATRELVALRGSPSGGTGSSPSHPSAAMEQLKADMQTLRMQISQHDAEKRQWLTEQRELVRRAETAAVQSALTREASSSESQQRSDLQAALRAAEEALADKDRELLVLRQERSALSTRQAQTGDMTAQLSVTVEEQRSHLRQKTEAVETLTSELRLLQRRLGDLQTAYDEEQEQHGNARTALQAKTERVQKTEREIEGLSEQLRVSEGDKERLEDHCSRLQRQAESVARRATSEREETRRLMSDKEVLEGRIEELRLLVGAMETTARTHSQKISRLLAQLEESQTTTVQSEDEIARLQGVLAEQHRTVAELEDSLRSVDHERDRIQTLLDGEQEASARRDAQRQAQLNEVAQLRQLLERSEKRTASVAGELTANQRQGAALEARVNSLKEENLELKRRVGMKSKEAGGAAEDLMLMTRENQALTHELAETASERDRLQRRVVEVAQLLSAREQSKKGVEMEKADLLDAYRAVLQEKRKMEEDMANLRAQKERVGMTALQMQDQLADLQGSQAAKGSEAARLQAERLALLRQLEKANDELTRGQRRTEAMEADNRRLMQDVHGLRSTNAMLNDRVQAIIKRAGEAGEANKLLSSKLQQVERERDTVRAAMAVERQRSAEMEHVATAARAQTAVTGAQLQRMTLRAVTTVATTPVPSSSSSTDSPSNITSLVPPDVTLASQPSATTATFVPILTINTTATASSTALDLPSSKSDDESPEGGPQKGDGQHESHRPINDVADEEDVDDVELTRGSSGSNTPTSGSRSMEISSAKVSPTSRFHTRDSRGSQPQESVNNDSTNSNSNDTSDLLLGLSENDSLYFTED